ncbi:MAG TPA: S41 family peptidase [Cyclobacteriaceae bacterium]|nr:S41 family peptidase [Cyclobacteriaceae bacterium]
MKNLMRARNYFFSGLILFSLIVLQACKDKDSVEADKSYVNRWIYDNMEFWYYWNTQIPSSPNRSLEPPDFFASLLSSEDRFSWIQDDYEELIKSLQGITKEAGYEYKLYRKQGTNNVFMQVMYVKPGSPASTVDLLRGDIIEKVNGIQMTLDNYRSVIELISENHTISYKRYNGSSFQDKADAALTTVEFSENPNFYHTVITLGGKKIGYYIYNFFANGPSGTSQTFNNQMDQIFTEFQSAGITDLILDLRFNSGGSESATINLASLIGKGINNNSIFAKREYNDQVEDAIIKEPTLGPGFLVSKFITKTQNVGASLSNVYVITGSRTASASELLINGLKPFMEVKIVGDTTVGKNMGSITITDDTNRKNKWGMQPIVVKSYNSLDQSDYSNGFIPDIADKDNDLVLLPLGDVNERLLNLALEDIVGGPVGGRISRSFGDKLSRPLFHSTDSKAKQREIREEKNEKLMQLFKSLQQ